MHPKAHLLLAAIGFAAITSCDQPPGPSPVGNLSNTATASPDISLRAWLRSTPLRPGTVHCAMKPHQTTDEVPYFTFNNKEKPQTTCLIDGPYSWNGHPWYVLRIRNINEPGRDSIRVCSLDAVKAVPPLPSPCGETAGPGGCKICIEGPHQP